MNITQVVIPAAGFGTRFLPYTKSVPKEMLALGNKPAIHYIAQEACDSALSDCIIITTAHKKAISDYFKPFDELNLFLREKNKLGLLDELNALIQKLNFTYINQDHAKGLGHAIALAKNSIGTNYFGVMLPDDIMVCQKPALAQLIEIAHQYNASVIAVQEVPKESISAYGVIKIKQEYSPQLFQIDDVIEKPAAHNAPSNLAIVGRYILCPQIFDELDQIKPAANGELQLTDAIAQLLHKGHKILAYKIQGTRYDIGIPAGWLHANNELAKQNLI